MQRRQPNEAYRPFPNMEARNFLQTAVELPLLLRLMEVPEGARILEVGCGRGVALPALVALRRPRRLVGVDIDPALLAVAHHAIARDRLPAEERTLRAVLWSCQVKREAAIA
jgi:tRNA1(Val) A37 N6-methylase TrmN6